VKTRDVQDLAAPEEEIHWRQLVRIERALATYAMDNDRLEMPWRIDAILIVVEPDGGVRRFDHLRSVYPG
jgi:Holliday junction resolvase-like predicted endonuclease